MARPIFWSSSCASRSYSAQTTSIRLLTVLGHHPFGFAARSETARLTRTRVFLTLRLPLYPCLYFFRSAHFITTISVESDCLVKVDRWWEIYTFLCVACVVFTGIRNSPKHDVIKNCTPIVMWNNYVYQSWWNGVLKLLLLINVMLRKNKVFMNAYCEK